MEPEELQLRLTILFELIEQGKADFHFVPETAAALQRVRRLPDRTFDLTTVDSPVRALCLLVDQIMEPSSPPADYEPLDQLPLVNLPNLQRRRISDSDFLADLVEAANVVHRPADPLRVDLEGASLVQPRQQRNSPVGKRILRTSSRGSSQAR